MGEIRQEHKVHIPGVTGLVVVEWEKFKMRAAKKGII